jgi:hypothetical protein
MGTIDVHHDGGVATIIISDPPQNRLGLDFVKRLSAAVDSIDASNARVLMIRGAGDHFSFGADLAEWLDTDVAGIRHYLVRLNSFISKSKGSRSPPLRSCAAPAWEVGSSWPCIATSLSPLAMPSSVSLRRRSRCAH